MTIGTYRNQILDWIYLVIFSNFRNRDYMVNMYKILTDRTVFRSKVKTTYPTLIPIIG